MLSLPAGAEKSEENNTAELELLSRAASAAVGESEYAVQVSLCAMLLNRKNGSGFPDTLAAVISDLLSEDTVLSLAFADAEPSERNIRAAAAALRGGRFILHAPMSSPQTCARAAELALSSEAMRSGNDCGGDSDCI